MNTSDSARKQFACPICKKRFNIGETQAFPFCSKRCRQIDLLRWLNEEYTVESFRQPDDEEEEDIPRLPDLPEVMK